MKYRSHLGSLVLSVDLFAFGTQKSGTTWLRNILASIGTVCEGYEWQLPILFEKLESYVVNCSGGRLVDPDMVTDLVSKTLEAALRLSGGATIDKSAYPCLAEAGRNDALFPQAMCMIRKAFPKARTLMIVRDPRDVLVSSAHYFGLNLAQLHETDVVAFANSWSKCNLAWYLLQPDSLVRFEDLKEEFSISIIKIFDDLNMNLDKDSIVEIERYRDIEFSQSIDNFFYRSGLSGAWAQFLPEHISEAIEGAAKLAMDTFGYE